MNFDHVQIFQMDMDYDENSEKNDLQDKKREEDTISKRKREEECVCMLRMVEEEERRRVQQFLSWAPNGNKK